MNKFILVWVACLAISLPLNVSACDQCACSAAGSFNDLSVFSTRNFVMLRTGYSHMWADEHQYVSVTSLSMDIAAAFSITPKLHVTAFVPVRFNTFSHEEDLYQLSGVGDIGAIANYILYTNQDSLMARNKYTLSVRGGIELPTGRFNTGFRQEDIPAALSPGSGSFDLISGARLRGLFSKTSVTVDYALRYHTVNQVEYRFGFQQSANATAGYLIKKPGYSILPYGGVSAEFVAGDTYHGYLQEGTTGYAWFTAGGLECALNSWVIGAQTDIPVLSHYDTEVHLKPRFSVRLSYMWN